MCRDSANVGKNRKRYVNRNDCDNESVGKTKDERNDCEAGMLSCDVDDSPICEGETNIYTSSTDPTRTRNISSG